MTWCIECGFWYWVAQWQGNCHKKNWARPKWSQDATVACCPDYSQKRTLTTDSSFLGSGGLTNPHYRQHAETT